MACESFMRVEPAPSHVYQACTLAVLAVRDTCTSALLAKFLACNWHAAVDAMAGTILRRRIVCFSSCTEQQSAVGLRCQQAPIDLLLSAGSSALSALNFSFAHAANDLCDASMRQSHYVFTSVIHLDTAAFDHSRSWVESTA